MGSIGIGKCVNFYDLLIDGVHKYFSAWVKSAKLRNDAVKRMSIQLVD